MATTDKGKTGDKEGMHVKFSQLVQDDTLLKPRLKVEETEHGLKRTQEAYRDRVLTLYETVSEVIGTARDPLEQGDISGLYGEMSDDTFNIDQLVAELSGEDAQLESEPQEYKDIWVRTVDEDDIPDIHFLAFMDSKTFYGKSGSVGEEDNNRGYLATRSEMRQVKEQLRKARENGDEVEVAELERVFESLQAGLRSDEPSASGSHTGKKNAEMLQDPPAESYAERKSG